MEASNWTLKRQQRTSLVGAVLIDKRHEQRLLDAGAEGRELRVCIFQDAAPFHLDFHT